MCDITDQFAAREEATKSSDYTYDEGDDYDEDNDWNNEAEWTEEQDTEAAEGDVAGEGAEYIEFLNREVSLSLVTHSKFLHVVDLSPIPGYEIRKSAHRRRQ
jgi:hypothetical protein